MKMKAFPSGVFLCIVLAAPTPFSANAESKLPYHVVNLGISRGNTGALRINNRGEIAGVSHDGLVAFLYTTDGRINELPLPPGAASPQIVDLNERGQVLIYAGLAAVIDGVQIYNTTLLADRSHVVDVKSVVGRPIVFGFALNNLGDIVGSDLRADFRYHPFLFSDGTFSLLDSGFGDALFTQAVDINDSRSILIWALLTVGTQPVLHTFVLSNGTMTDIGSLPGGGGTSGQRINNRGHVMGISQAGTNNIVHSFLWQDGRMIDLGDSRFFDLNNNDEMIGRNADYEPVIYTGGAEHRLAPLIQDIGRYDGFEINSINDASQIVGSGTHRLRTEAILIEPSKTPAHEP